MTKKEKKEFREQILGMSFEEIVEIAIDLSEEIRELEAKVLDQINKDAIVQAWLNKTEWYKEDVQKV